MNRPRILIVENSTAVTGALISILRSSHSLKDRFEFIFLLPENSSAISYVNQFGFKTCTLPMKELRKNLSSVLLYIPFLLFNTLRFFRLVKMLNANIITGNDYYNLIPPVYRLFGGKVPYICYVRFLPSKFPSWLADFWWRWHVRFASSIVVVSQAVSEQLPASGKVVTIGNELPDVDVQFSEVQSQLILYVSNYIPGKGQEYALRSFALVAGMHPKWKLKFVGGDMDLEKNRNFKSSLMQLSNELGIHHQTEWMDFEENIAKVYSEASFVLNFSESESFSMTVLEAMFYGRTVIATRCGGPEEIIDDKINGLLVPTSDVNAMGKAIEFMISQEDERRRMSKAAYKSVRIRYSKERTIDKLGELYSWLLNSTN